MTWNTVKDIYSRYFERHYAPPVLDGVDSIDIDKFAVRKGRVYKTIVVDLKSDAFSMWARERASMSWMASGRS